MAETGNRDFQPQIFHHIITLLWNNFILFVEINVMYFNRELSENILVGRCLLEGVLFFFFFEWEQGVGINLSF